MFKNSESNGAGSENVSVIDDQMRITGTVISDGDVILAGQLDGQIICNKLTVEHGAILNGSVETGEVVISGNVTGDVVSINAQIESSGHFEGDLKCIGIEVEAGAHVVAKFKKAPAKIVKAAARLENETD
jgi:cytoskeletal protein CcmA (bactofilin family)